jgi:tRNA A-37 threonylcarbamoyl transferase component Bud32
MTPGTVFAGDYRVVQPLNQGGMGAVYVVQQLSTGKMRALKLMHASLVSDAMSRARFEQEARIGARIASEHVVEVVAAGVDPQTHVPYLVMELLEGEDMSTRLRRGTFEPAEAALVLEQIAHALGAAHDAGVVHRDLKPENVFLGVSKRSNATQIVKLLDFGIAKVTEENQRNTTGAYGTPMWLAPEQTRRGEITPAADVWAFGLLAFTMLTGHAFWPHAEGPNASLPSLIQDITMDPIPHASSRALEFAMHLPPGFDAWLETTLQREPRMRFPNARAAWAALAPILSAPIELAPAPKKSSGLIVALVAALVLLLLALVGTLVVLIHAKATPVATATTATTTMAIATSAATTLESPPQVITPVASQDVVAATAPLASVSAPTAPTETFRIGGMVQSLDRNEVLYQDALHKWKGPLARELDKCLAALPLGKISQRANVDTTVAKDGSVISAHQYTDHPGPIGQCMTDTISKQRFVSTPTGGHLVFSLMWNHG